MPDGIAMADYQCLTQAQELVQSFGTSKDKRKMALNTLRTADGVLRNHNVFLCYLAMIEAKGEGGDKINDRMFALLASPEVALVTGGHANDQERRGCLTQLAETLEDLLLAKNLVRRMLAYAVTQLKPLAKDQPPGGGGAAAAQPEAAAATAPAGPAAQEG